MSCSAINARGNRRKGSLHSMTRLSLFWWRTALWFVALFLAACGHDAVAPGRVIRLDILGKCRYRVGLVHRAGNRASE